MTQRSTRNKICWQCDSAIDDMVKALGHLAGVAAHSADRSMYIDTWLPSIMAALEEVILTTKKFREGL